MQKWEYKVAHFAEPQPAGRFNYVVINTDGNPIGKWGILAWSGGQDFYSWLEEMGNAGWEAISHSDSPSGSTWQTHMVILKRPKA